MSTCSTFILACLIAVFTGNTSNAMIQPRTWSEDVHTWDDYAIVVGDPGKQNIQNIEEIIQLIDERKKGCTLKIRSVLHKMQCSPVSDSKFTLANKNITGPARQAVLKSLGSMNDTISKLIAKLSEKFPPFDRGTATLETARAYEQKDEEVQEISKELRVLVEKLESFLMVYASKKELTCSEIKLFGEITTFNGLKQQITDHANRIEKAIKEAGALLPELYRKNYDERLEKPKAEVGQPLAGSVVRQDTENLKTKCYQVLKKLNESRSELEEKKHYELAYLEALQGKAIKLGQEGKKNKLKQALLAKQVEQVASVVEKAKALAATKQRLQTLEDKKRALQNQVQQREEALQKQQEEREMKAAVLTPDDQSLEVFLRPLFGSEMNLAANIVSTMSQVIQKILDARDSIPGFEENKVKFARALRAKIRKMFDTQPSEFKRVLEESLVNLFLSLEIPYKSSVGAYCATGALATIGVLGGVAVYLGLK